MKEGIIYEPIRKWLRSRGYRALVTGGKKEVSIFVGDILPAKANIEPDVVGIADSWSDNVCVEAKPEKIVNIFDVIGKCIIWQLASKSVYLAVPSSDGFRKEGLAKMGLGLLFVSGDTVQEVVAPNYYGPVDDSKSQEFYNQSLRAIRSHYGVIDGFYPKVESLADRWAVRFTAKNIGSKPIKVLDLLLDGVPYSRKNCALVVKLLSVGTSSRVNQIPLDIESGAGCDFSLEIPKTSVKGGSNLRLDFSVEDGTEKGSSFYLP